MLKDFKEFAFKGNMIDMAVGIIIGGAFGLTVKSLVGNVLMPVISGVFKVPDFKNLFHALDGNEYASLELLEKAGAPAVKYGVFMNDVINLLIVAMSLFLMIRYVVNAMKKKEEEKPAAPPEPTKEEKLLSEIRDLLSSRAAPAE